MPSLPPRAFLVVVATLLLALAAGLWAVARELSQPFPLAAQSYVQSETCVRCHPDHTDSWFQTYHRTMTQEAGPESVLADFDEASYRYQGVTSRFSQADDRYFIETLGVDGVVDRFEVVRTVGSRRVQQYLTRSGDRYLRLPLAWNIEEGRWFHLNGGFLHPDGSDFNEHLALWDANCIFCHNVKADPGYDFETQTFDSQVAELGIACEACHGPGEAHIARNANPLRRYYLYLTGADDPTIVSPADLEQEAMVQTCGHCHGQRLPNPESRIREFLAEGDPYTAGEDLDHYTTPIWQESTLADFAFAPRFWGDGTPRLTAYEYQGLILSEGHWGQSDLTCISCHTMHGGDPKGMIEPEMRGAEGCLQCHGEIGEDVPAHTRHKAESPGSDCYACHMPDITYGLLASHPTHRIQNPDPSRAWRYEMPEACTLCHLDQSAPWAAAAFADAFAHPAVEPPAGPAFQNSETIRALLAGDVVQRAIAVEALAAETSYTADPRARLWAVPFLMLTMERDRYPAIRHFAYRALVTLTTRAAAVDDALAPPTAAQFDALAEPAARAEVLADWQAWWAALDKGTLPSPAPSVPLDARFQPIPARVEPLLAAQDNTLVSIGE